MQWGGGPRHRAHATARAWVPAGAWRLVCVGGWLDGLIGAAARTAMCARERAVARARAARYAAAVAAGAPRDAVRWASAAVQGDARGRRGASASLRARAVLLRHAGEAECAVAAVRVCDGRRVLDVNASEPFPLASVAKLQLLIEAARRLSRGELSLRQRVRLRPDDACIGSGSMHAKGDQGAHVSLSELLRASARQSDNTAADALLRAGLGGVREGMRTGGASDERLAALTQREAFLLSLGQADELRGLRPRALARRWLAMSPAEQDACAAAAAAEAERMPFANFDELERASERELLAEETRGHGREAHAAAAEVAAAVDNLGSAHSVASELADALGGRGGVSPQWRRHLLSLLPCGGVRLGADLPDGASVRHKTGTLCGVVNDAGALFADGGQEASGEPALAACVLCRRVAQGKEGVAKDVAATAARLALAAA